MKRNNTTSTRSRYTSLQRYNQNFLKRNSSHATKNWSNSRFRHPREPLQINRFQSTSKKLRQSSTNDQSTETKRSPTDSFNRNLTNAESSIIQTSQKRRNQSRNQLQHIHNGSQEDQEIRWWVTKEHQISQHSCKEKITYTNVYKKIQQAIRHWVEKAGVEKEQSRMLAGETHTSLN